MGITLLHAGLMAGMLLTAFSPAMAAKINEKAQQDFNAGLQKAREGDKLFGQKKWGEAADALQAALKSMEIGVQRDPQLDDNVTVTFKDVQSASDYGYTVDYGGYFSSEDGGRTAKINQTFYRRMLRDMGRDAALMAGRRVAMKVNEENGETEAISDDGIQYFLQKAAEAVHKIKLPAPDDQLGGVVSALQRSLLKFEAIKALDPKLSAHADWHFGPLGSNQEMTPDEVAKIAGAKLAEAAPDYEKAVADRANADPDAYADTLKYDLDSLNAALAGANKDGWVNWGWVRELYISKNYMADRRKVYGDIFTKAGKDFPADKLKPLEDKLAAIKAAMEKNAPRWSFPTGVSHDAAIEAHVKSAVKAVFPGATIYKTALATGWNIETNDVGIPKWRNRGVYVLLKKPGETWAWLILGEYIEDYAGGGNYSGGAFAPPYREARLQKAQ